MCFQPSQEELVVREEEPVSRWLSKSYRSYGMGSMKDFVERDTNLSCNKKNNDPLQCIWFPILQDLQEKSHIVLQNATIQ
jgi:hypothetical protein